jgi:hypothetical protein
LEAGGDDVEMDTKSVAERLEVGGVSFVTYVFHSYMQSLDTKVRDVDLGATGKELEQTEGVLATRQSDEDSIVLVDELELSQRLVKSFPKSFLERHLVIHKHQIYSTDNEEER